MKKSLLVVFSALLLVSLTGCGSKKQVTCSGTVVEEGISMKTSVTVDLDSNDKITGGSMTYDLGDKQAADQFCSLYKMFASAESGVSVSCSGTKITIKGFDKMEDDEDAKVIGKTKDEFIKAMEAEGLTCK